MLSRGSWSEFHWLWCHRLHLSGSTESYFSLSFQCNWLSAQLVSYLLLHGVTCLPNWLIAAGIFPRVSLVTFDKAIWELFPTAILVPGAFRWISWNVKLVIIHHEFFHSHCGWWWSLVLTLTIATHHAALSSSLLSSKDFLLPYCLELQFSHLCSCTS